MVKKVINFVYREVRGLHQAAYIIALFAFGSQILAIVRDRLLAHTFGAGAELDLYYTAFRVPDLLYVLFASVLSIYVLLPFVNKANELEGEKGGVNVLSQVFTIFLLFYSVTAGVLALVAPMYTHILFPGFASEQENLVTLMRILLLQPLLLGLSSLAGVVTQMNHRFVLYAVSPLLYNLGIIFGITLLYPLYGLQGLVFGVVIGALGHLLIQVPFLFSSKYIFSITKTFDWKLLTKILVISVPRALTLSVNQLLLLVFVGIASMMTTGSVSVFQFAFNLQSVPLVIIGMSYSVAAFPTLSSLFAKKDEKGFNRQLLTALRHIVFWSVPVIALVVVLRAHIVRILLGSGEFDWGDTRLTAAMLAVFVVSLLAQSVLLLLIRAFYARGKTMLPLFAALFSGVVSIGLSFLFRDIYLSHESLHLFINGFFRLNNVLGSEVLVLAFAFTLGQILQVVALLLISRKSFGISYKSLVKLFFQSCLAGFIGAVSSYVTLAFVVDGINQETFIGISLQAITAGIIGLFVVVLTYRATNSKELQEIYSSFYSRLFKTDIITPQQD